MPFGAPSVDQYGGDRAGDNLFGTSIVAADANTGKYLWHFQVVHHDIWDARSVRRAGADRRQAGRQDDSGRRGDQQARAAVPARSRHRQADLRRRGAAGAAERSAARTRVEDAAVSAQAGAALAHDDDAGGHRDGHAGARSRVQEADGGRADGRPVSAAGATTACACSFPGNHGGVNWGGTSFNPQLGYLFVNTNELGQLAGMTDRDPNATGPAQGDGQGNRVASRTVRTRASPAAAASRTSAMNMMCQQPPWGQLTAVNVNTGEFAWRVPLGVTDSLPPDKQKTGRPGNGGTIATAGGLVFVGATDDAGSARSTRRPARSCGRTSWAAPRRRRRSPISGKDGRQYVVITSTGGGFFGEPVTDDSIMAFALPDSRRGR